MKVIYLSGNHDNIKVLEVLKSEFGDFITFGDYLTIGEGEVKEVRVEHGHLVTMAPIGLDLKAQLIKEQEEDQKRRSVFKRTVLKVFSRIPLEGPLAIVGNNVVGGWINRWRFIPPKLKAKVITTDTKMREYAEQGTSANLHIFGHTHTVAQGEKYINPGSFLRVPIMRDRFVAVYLDEEGKAQLIDCVTGKETTVKEIYASRITSLMRVVGRIIERAKLIE